MLEVIGRTNLLDFSKAVKTRHMDERIRRVEAVNGLGKPQLSFECNTGHPNGNEIHTITDKGNIVIQNAATRRIVTTLIARPGQIARYFDLTGEKKPDNYEDLIYQAQTHVMSNLNN